MLVFRGKGWAWLLVVVLVASFTGWYLWGLQGTALISLNQGNLSRFEQSFDQSGTGARVVVLLSPT